MHWTQQNLVCTSSDPTWTGINAWISKNIYEYGKLSPANVSCILAKAFKTIGHIFPLVYGKNKGHCLKCTCTVKIHTEIPSSSAGYRSEPLPRLLKALSTSFFSFHADSWNDTHWLEERFQSDRQKTNGSKQWVSRKKVVDRQIYGSAVCHWIKYLLCFILSGHIFKRFFHLPSN